MTARLLIPPSATYEEWKAKRAELSRNAVTASEIAIILGISPWGSPFNLYHLKRGTITDDYEDDTLSLGRHLEPWIAERWAADHPEFELDLGGLWASEDRPWQMSTPDRLLFERTMCWACHGGQPVPCVCDERIPSLLEIKHSGSYDGWGEDGTDEVPAYYRAQVLWQMDTLGLEVGHVTCFFLATRSRRDYVIKFDEADVKLMRDAAREFLAQVERGDPPPIDHHPATLTALKALNPALDDDAEAEVPKALAKQYAEACSFYRRAKDHKALAENKLRDAMGSAKRATYDGKTVATRSVYEVAEHTRAACTVDKLTAPRAKKEAS